MEIRILGSIEVAAAGEPTVVQAPKLRRLLAVLLTRAGETCPPDLLVDAVWGGSPPRSSGKLLQLYVSQLRKLLPVAARIRTHGAGYVLELSGECVDAVRFERLVEEGRAALQGGNPALARSLLGRGLALWRGQAYGELAYEQFARVEAERLEELRIAALEERLEAELALGNHREVLPELQSLAGSQPLRERLQTQVMLALYRCGRQSEALETYARTRATLRDELGLEPSRELRKLQRRILQHDSSLLIQPSPENAIGSLPASPNRLLGRERELAELGELLVRDEVRLLVLTGAGGSGKTRLALEAARRLASSFANGAVFVGLAPVRDPDLLLAAIARGLELEDASPDALGRVLQTRELLLLLDNAEHLRAAGPRLVELLASAPRLTLLVTSRVVLHLSGEHVYPVEPLTQQSAIALFHARAREADPRFPADRSDGETVKEICARLDRLPLAIELAASHVRTLTPRELLVRLEPRLPLLTGGPADLPARQLTMNSTIEWSLDLLSEQQRQGLFRLSVFVGGFTLDAAEAVCGVTITRLTALIDHNLLHRSTTATGSRYRLLELIREYAETRLRDSDEYDAIWRLHTDYLVELAESANLTAEAEGAQDFDAVLPEHANARAAIEWALAAGEVQLGLQLAVALENFWVTRNPFEGVNLLTRLLDAGRDAPLPLRARALRACAGSAHLAGQRTEAEDLYEQSLAAFRALGDEKGIAILTYRLGYLALEGGRLTTARTMLEQSRAAFKTIGSPRGEAQTIGALGALAHAEGKTDLATTLYQQSARLAARIGRTWWQARMLAKIADVALEEKRYDEAAEQALEALRIARRIGNRQTIIQTLAQLAASSAASGDTQRAGALWGAIESEEARAPVGSWETERDRYAKHVLQPAHPNLDSALVEGRKLSLTQAVSLAETLQANTLAKT